MKSRRKRLEQKLGTAAFVWAQKWLFRKDALQSERIGEKLGRLAFRLSKKHRLRALSNLELAMPELTPAERTDLALRTFEHFGRVAADFVRTPIRTPEDFSEIEVFGREHLDQLVSQNQGAILITGHFGNWERACQWYGRNDYKLSVVVRDANDDKLNDMVLLLRKDAGVGVISRGSAARQILSTLKRNEFIGILPDQNSDEIYVPFFGKPCGTVQGPAVLSERARCPVVPMYCVRIGANKYRIRIGPPLKHEPGYEGTPEGITRAINSYLEAAIREYPEQWLWFHDRWKSARRKGLL